MTEGMIAAMQWIGGAGLTLAVILFLLEARSNLRKDCRACGAELDRRGGYHVPEVGNGFCGSCARNLNSFVRKP